MSATPIFKAPITNPFGLANVGNYTNNPSFADIDNDGDLDAFIGDFPGSLEFFKNTGTANNPAFAAAVIDPFGLAPTVGVQYARPTFADIDGDGDLDAFVGNDVGNTIFYKNIGTVDNPAFGAKIKNPFGLKDVGTNAAPSFADIDGDGDLDLFLGSNYGELRFYRNTGSATNMVLAAPVKNPFGLTVAGGYIHPTFADVDGDGDLDAWVGNSAGEIKFFENTGTANAPAFAAALTNPFGFTTVNRYSSPAFADIDGDGDLDAFVGNNLGDTSFFLNDTPKPGITISQTNGDTAVTEGGAKDTYTVVLNTQPTADVTITLNTTNKQASVSVASLTFTTANWNVTQTVTVTAVNDSVGEGAHQGVIKHTAASVDGDYNGLAALDLTVAIADNDLPNRNPKFNPPKTNPFSLTNVGGSASPTFADIDGDGDLDAFVGNFAGDTLFFRNTGTAKTPKFAAAATNLFGLADVGVSANPTFADIDGDGDLDAFIGEYYGDMLFFQNTGTAGNAVFAAAAANPFGLDNVGHLATPSFADIDGDGDLDAFVGEGYGNILFFENKGTAGSAAFAAAKTNPFGLVKISGIVSPTFVDVDGDGDLDALVGNLVGDVSFYLNTGTATNAAFAAPVNNPFGLTDVGNNATPSLVDIDGDGDLDAFVGNSSGDIRFYLNNVAPTLTAFASAVAVGNEDAAVEITLAQLKAQGNEADADGTVNAFVIKAVSSGSLKVGATAATATAWVTGGNDTVDAAHRAYWTGAKDANGILKAFTAVAKDNNAAVSGTAIQATVNITAVNDAPGGANKIAASLEDKPYAIKAADFGFSDANDNPANTLQAVKIVGLPSAGTLKLNGLAVSLGQLVSATDIIANKLVLTPATNANGNNYAHINFQVQDNGGTANGGINLDPTANTLTFNVIKINDLPTGVVTATGLATQGKTLVASNTLADVDGLGTITYTWKTGTTVLGTGNTYTLKATDVGNSLTVTASYTDQDGSLESKTSSATGVVGLSKTGTANADVLAGTAGDDSLAGLGGNDILQGDSGNDVLDGGDGDDTLIGGAGNDVYMVNANGDVVTEIGGGGMDTIFASINIANLAANVENLVLTGTTGISGTGNLMANTLTGNAANNVLSGGVGNDSLNGGGGNDTLVGSTGNDNLTGGAGQDSFRFNAALAANIDKITDFVVADDTIQLENAIFTKLAVVGVLPNANFKINAAATDADDFIVYNKATGALFYDADGNGAGATVQIAALGVNLALTNADFAVI